MNVGVNLAEFTDRVNDLDRAQAQDFHDPNSPLVMGLMVDTNVQQHLRLLDQRVAELERGLTAPTGHHHVRTQTAVLERVRTDFYPATPTAFSAARSVSRRPEMLTPYTPTKLATMRTFLSSGGGAGYALTADNDLVNVFNNSGTPGLGQMAVIDGIKRGADTLDAFAGFLPEYYARFGFMAYKTDAWDDAYAPPNWNYETMDRPDIVYMRYEGGPRETIEQRIDTFPGYAYAFYVGSSGNQNPLGGPATPTVWPGMGSSEQSQVGRGMGVYPRTRDNWEDGLRQTYGQAWLDRNHTRLDAEWEYVQELGGMVDNIREARGETAEGEPWKQVTNWYHGTKSAFGEFNTPAFFTNERTVAEHYAKGEIPGRVVTVQLDIKNPKIEVSAPMMVLDKDIRRLKAQGYDALIQDVGDGRYDVVVFDKSQIKSSVKEYPGLEKPGPLRPYAHARRQWETGYFGVESQGLYGRPWSGEPAMVKRFTTEQERDEWVAGRRESRFAIGGDHLVVKQVVAWMHKESEYDPNWNTSYALLVDYDMAPEFHGKASGAQGRGMVNQPASYPPLYHGTMTDYPHEDIKTGQRMFGIHLTTSVVAAGEYGKVTQYTLDPGAKVLDLSDGYDLWAWMDQQGIIDEDDKQNIDLENYVVSGQLYQYDISSKTHLADDVARTAKSLGYDVVKMPDNLHGEGDNIAWVVVNPQVLIAQTGRAKGEET